MYLTYNIIQYFPYNIAAIAVMPQFYRCYYAVSWRGAGYTFLRLCSMTGVPQALATGQAYFVTHVR